MNPTTKTVTILITGTALGWLIGMTASPVTQGVIATLLAAIVGLVTALAGMKFDQTRPDALGADTRNRIFIKGIDPLPVMALVLGIALGAALGIYTRSHNLLGSEADAGIDPAQVIAKYAPLGLDEKVIAQRLFDIEYPAGKVLVSEAEQKRRAGVLFDFSSSECARFCAYEGEDLWAEIEVTDNADVEKWLAEGRSKEAIGKAIKQACACGD